MDTSTFWRLIEDSRAAADDVEEHTVRLVDRLAALAPQEIVAFHSEYRRHKARAYTWRLWAAGYLINGGCSDDGFEYFRDWLIAQGQQVFEWALADADSLTDLDLPQDQDAEAEDLGGAAQAAYRRLIGIDIPLEHVASPAAPAGEPWQDEDLDTLLPRLSARY
jgi:Protein of unknown function (DUF4240)